MANEGVSDALHKVRETLRNRDRLAEVRRTELLDSPPEESFDRLTRLASRLVGAPAAFIALIDEERDFYKSIHGFSEPLATTRQLTGPTICHYAVAGSAPLVIPDIRAHPVYSQVPTVESLGVAAYVGIPLVTSGGKAVGSFCVVDFEPREWRELDIEIMRELAASTLREIELRLTLRDAESARERARTVGRAWERIIAVLSHDLRDPLHNVRSSASTLLHLPIADAERRRFLEMIERSAGTMSRLVADLLAISEIETGGLRVDAKPIDPGALLQDAVEMLAPAVASRGLELLVGATPDLPPVLADRSRIRQVFARLVGSAIDGLPPGCSLVLRAAAHDVGVVFTVSDTATRSGEAPDRKPQNFDTFPPMAEPRPGPGLGLAVVHDIVRAHGGAVSLESTPGAGTTFSFTMPSAPIAPRRRAAALRSAAPG